MGVKHNYTSTKDDPVDTTLVGKTKWNDDHYFTGGGVNVGAIVYASTSGLLANLNSVASGQVLTSAGAGTAPAWSANPTINSLTLTGVTTSANGVVFKGADRFIHNYFDPTSTGVNTFLGVGAGNFTMGPSGGANYLGSYNTGLGYISLSSLTTGFDNTAVGENTLKATTTGNQNVAVGSGAMIANTIGQLNVAVGSSCLYGNVNGNENVAIGNLVGHTSTAANTNVSGRFNVWIGQDCGAGTTSQLDDTVVLGAYARSTKSHQVVLGANTITENLVWGAMVGTEMTAPAAPAANGYALYAEDNGSGKTRLMVLFASGAAQQIAIQP